MMSILVNNINAAMQAMMEKVAEVKDNKEIGDGHVLVQVAYNEESFELHSIALSQSEGESIPDDIAKDAYYNMVFIVDGIDNVAEKFRNKYQFRVAYSDISFALYTAYKLALKTDDGEYSYSTSFELPGLKNDISWAYHDVFEFSDLGQFRCWFNYDEQFQKVDIQADTDLIAQYDELKPSATTLL